MRDSCGYRARLAELARAERALPLPGPGRRAVGAALAIARDHLDELDGAAQHRVARLLIDHGIITGRELAVVPTPTLARILAALG